MRTLLAVLIIACGSPSTHVVRREAPRAARSTDARAVASAPQSTEADEPHDGAAPFAVEGIDDAVEVAVGDEHSCARRRNGGVVCWGANYAGQLGPAATAPYSTRPTAVPGMEETVELHAGAAHTCARKHDGSVLCWGDNRLGQLGGGSPTDRGPRAVRVRGARRLSGNATITCAIVAQDRAHCWGRHLGHEYARGQNAYYDPSVRAARARHIVQIGLGNAYGCALNAAGRVSCWGQNEYGQLGRETDGDGWNDLSSAPVQGLPASDQLAVAGEHACVRTREGHVYCWGSDGFGEVTALAEHPEREGDTAPPARVRSLEHVAELATVAEHTCARHEDGRVICWGVNVFGELGAGGANSSGPLGPRSINDAIDIAAGRHHSCAVRRTGGVVCWGDDECGQVGAPVVARAGFECAYDLDEPTPREGGGLIHAAD